MPRARMKEVKVIFRNSYTYVYTHTHTRIYIRVYSVRSRPVEPRMHAIAAKLRWRKGKMQEPCSTIIRLYKRCKVDNCKVADRAI